MKDETSFTKAYRAHYAYIYSMLGRYVADVAMREDLTQQTFLKAWLHEESFRGDSSYRTWLTRIAINTALSFLTSQKLKPEYFAFKDVDPNEVYTMADTLSEVITAQEMHNLSAALDHLPPAFKTILNLQFTDNLSYQEIATHLNIPVGTVRSRLNRAKNLLKDILQ